jgi:hypothetical protein
VIPLFSFDVAECSAHAAPLSPFHSPSPFSLPPTYKAARFPGSYSKFCVAISPHVKIPFCRIRSSIYAYPVRLSGRTAHVTQGGRQIRTPKSIHAPHLPHPTLSRLIGFDWLRNSVLFGPRPYPRIFAFDALVHDEEVQLLHQQGLLMGAGQVGLAICDPYSSHSIASQNK